MSSYSGRRRLCRAFCITYAGSCVLIQQPILPVLFAGRVLGGLSTAILFSVFESWLVASFQGLPATLALSGNTPNVKAAVSRALSLTMGRAALVNGIVAAGAGVVANWIVGHTENFRAPFILSGILLIIAWVIIGNMWDENYGAQKSTSSGGGELSKIAAGLGMVRRGVFLFPVFKGVSTDSYYAEPAFLVLGLTQTCFEGSMYLFVFLWVPSLQEAGGSELPLGYIFSSFMISMMLGSIVYTTISSTATITSPSNLPTDGRTDGSSTNKPSADSILVLHAKLASLICACAALSLAYTASFQPNSTGIAVASRKFWAFCLFEACVGAYYPVMGMLRGAFVPNEVRATVRFLSPMRILSSGSVYSSRSTQLSSLFRVPLNIFVTAALVTGVSSARHLVFAGSTLLLATASIACAVVLIPRAENHGSENGEQSNRSPTS